MWPLAYLEDIIASPLGPGKDVITQPAICPDSGEDVITLPIAFGMDIIVMSPDFAGNIVTLPAD